MITWAAVILVLFADYLIIKKDRVGFVLWLLCDGFFCVNSGLKGNYPESVAFGMYAIMGIFGFTNWKS
jgi:hypothetical protein